MSHINVIGKYVEAVWIIIAVALLLVSLGIYVYLGSKAKGLLLNNRDKKSGLIAVNNHVI